MGDTPRTLLFSDVLCGPATLRAAGGTALSDTERVELLNRSLAGEHIEITVDIRPFSQMDNQPNRNFTRFRTGSLNALGRSGKGTVYLHNHDQGNLSERGGTITASKMNKIDGGHELSQTIKVVEAKHVQALLKGTADRFSIGWHATGPINCTVCQASIYKCWWEHWPGKTVELEDGTKQVVEYEFQSAELVETSAVNVPAVVGTTVEQIRASLSANAPTRGERQMPNTPPAQNSADTQKATEAGERAGTERCLAIMRTAKALNLDDALRDQHITEGTSADEFRKLAVDAFEARHEQPIQDQGRPSISAGDDARDKLGASLQGAILLRAGNLSRVQAGLGKAEKSSLYAGPVKFEAARAHRGLSLREMARMMLHACGVQTDGMTTKEMVGRAFVTGSLSISGGNSTSDFPNLLENTLHKVLLAEYMLAADTWSRFCGQGTVTDFREHPRYRRGSIANLKKVNEHGEIENARVPDARREQISADEYGLIIAITRKAIINDDLDSFSRLPADLGRAAARTIETAVYALLAENDGLGPAMGDSLPLFDAAHNNISPGSVLSVAGLDEDRRTFRRQKDESGRDFLDVMPEVLLVPLALGSKARQIIGAEFDVDSGVPNNRSPNVVRNMVQDVVDSPRLDENGTTNKLTRRYLFGDPAVNRAIEVVRLAGENGPSLEARDGWRVSGREWRIVDDWGVGAVDYKTAVTNAGV